MADFKLVTPVAFIIFNRPDVTARVFAEIAKARPPMLLVVGDGPRVDRIGEAQKVAEARAIIERVDWPCQVLTNFSMTNLGCRKRVSTGIDWVFEQVEEAIILEDDCLPDSTFFRYCQEMLVRYRYDQRIGMISGDNFQIDPVASRESYYFSKYVHIWGWATWRDRWHAYDVEMAQWPLVRDQALLTNVLLDPDQEAYWKEIFERVYLGDIDTWDYQWAFANLIEGRLNILPSVNLISNIGFGAGATHTVGLSPLANLPTENMSFPLTHPAIRCRNVIADRVSDRRCFRIPLWRRLSNAVINKLNRVVHRDR